jgi:hypothetical protein
MADTVYMSYEQVLQTLQTNRGQLNQFIRSGRLRQHVVDGETKFRGDEVTELKNELEKEPTVMEDWQSEDDGGTAILDEEGTGEPATQVIEDASGERTTDVIDESGEVPQPDTVMLEEDTPDPDTVMLEEDEDEQMELAGEEEGEFEDGFELELDTDDVSASESALETELDLDTVSAEDVDEQEMSLEDEEEDFFDFSGDLEDVDFELESGEDEEQFVADSEELVLGEDNEDVVTEVLDLGGDQDMAEEDLLSEIMDIEEEDMPGGEPITEGSADITAEITTMEEPTYEESDLDQLLEAEEDLGAFEDEFVEEEEDFEVPYAAPVESPGQISVLFVGLLILTVIVLLGAGWFVVENSVSPKHDTWLGEKVYSMMADR